MVRGWWIGAAGCVLACGPDVEEGAPGGGMDGSTGVSSSTSTTGATSSSTADATSAASQGGTSVGSDDTTTGDSQGPGGEPTGDDSTGAATTGGPDTGGTVSCDPVNDPCLSCVFATCCDELQACGASASCTCWYDCVLGGSWLSCTLTCGGLPGPAAQPLIECGSQMCSGACSGGGGA